MKKLFLIGSIFVLISLSSFAKNDSSEFVLNKAGANSSSLLSQSKPIDNKGGNQCQLNCLIDWVNCEATYPFDEKACRIAYQYCLVGCN